MPAYDPYGVFDRLCDSRAHPAWRCYPEAPCHTVYNLCEKCFYDSTRLHAELTDAQCPGGNSGEIEEHCSCFATSKYCCKCGFEPKETP